MVNRNACGSVTSELMSFISHFITTNTCLAKGNKTRLGYTSIHNQQYIYMYMYIQCMYSKMYVIFHARIEPRAKYSRDDIIGHARAAEKDKDYTTVLSCMRDAIERNPSLSSNERTLLATSFKSLCAESREKWKALVDSPEREREREREMRAAEVEDVCQEALSLVSDNLLPAAKDAESKTFYLKMKADYTSCLNQVTPDSDVSQKSQRLQAAVEAQNTAYETSHELPQTHPVRLGIALNYALFQQELKKPEVALRTAKRAFDDAVQQLDSLSEDSYKESTEVMQLLRDNMTLWGEEQEKEKEKMVEEAKGKKKKKMRCVHGY